MAGLQDIGILNAKDLAVLNYEGQSERIKQLIRTLEASKTEHELPNNYGFEYNIGFVDALNSVLSRLKPLIRSS